MARDDDVPRKTNGKKRKRPKISAEEQLNQEREERYNKLVFMAKRNLHKEAKVVKSFECQKAVRRLKQDGSNKKLEQRLHHVKGYSIDKLVEVCLQRLGVPNLDPNKEEKEKTGVSTQGEMGEDDRQLLERMLKHKRLVTAMEIWNEKVTEYSRWNLRRQERVAEVPEIISKSKKKRDAKNKKIKHKTGPRQSSDLFVRLSGPTEQEGGHAGPERGDETDEYAAIVKQKKNRPGQRARKAKAMAMEARKEGRTWDSSLNWREKKPKPTNDEEPYEKEKQVPHKVQPAEIAAMGKTWKEDGQAHPSWAARQSEKSGIVEFTGKKITFD